MPLVQIYCVVVGLSMAGIGYVVWLMFNDPEDRDSLVQRINPDDLKNFDRSGKLQPQKEKKPPIAPVKKTLPAAKQVKNPEPLVQKAVSKTAAKTNMFKQLLGDKKNKRFDITLNDIKPLDDNDQFMPKKTKSFMDKLNFKLSFGRKKINPQDDIPEATTFASLTKKSSEQDSSGNKGKEKLSDMRTGTASLTTTQYNELNEPAQDKIPEQLSVKNDLTVLKRELEASSQLEEWKTKYKKLDTLFREKSQHLESAEKTLTNELKNRDDFFKLKAILESEMKEVKDRARELHHALKNAQMETEQQKMQADQLKDKVNELEETIQQKQQELDQAKKTGQP